MPANGQAVAQHMALRGPGHGHGPLTAKPGNMFVEPGVINQGVLDLYRDVMDSEGQPPTQAPTGVCALADQEFVSHGHMLGASGPAGKTLI